MATVNLSDYKPLQITDADDFTIGIVVSEWNDFVTFNLRDGAEEVLKKEIPHHVDKRDLLEILLLTDFLE